MDYKGIPFEIKKMKQGMSYSRKEKTIIMNVFKYFRIQHPDKTVTEIVRCTAKATGCSEKSIFSFRKEEISPQGFKEPSKIKIRKNVNTNNRLVKYNESIREAIKSIIYDLKRKDIVPSLSIILKNINSSNLPSFSIMTLRRLLCDMGFYYEKNGNKSILVEKGSNKNSIDSNVQPSEIAKTNLSEKLGLVSNTIPNDLHEKNNSQTADQTFCRPQNVDEVCLKKIDEKFQSYQQINVPQTHRIQAFGCYQENHLSTLGPPPSSHVPLMFPPGMPPYHLHSSVPHSYPSNIELHYKREGTSVSLHHPQLPSHNVVMH